MAILSTTASSTASTFSPVLADIAITSSGFIQTTFSSSAVTLGTFAAGRSTLLSTGMIVRLFSRAMYKVLKV